METFKEKEFLNVKLVFDELVKSLYVANDKVMGITSAFFKEGDFDNRKKWMNKLDTISSISESVHSMQKEWESTFLNVNDKRAEEVSAEIIENEIISAAGGYLGGYVCSGDSIKMEFASNSGQGRGYSLKIKKEVFEKIVIFTLDYLKINAYIQSKDIILALNDYLEHKTNYKDIRSIVSKTLRFLTDQTFLTLRNGVSGYYVLNKERDAVLQFVDEIKKR